MQKLNINIQKFSLSKLTIIFLYAIGIHSACSQHPPEIADASSIETYKSTPDADLKLWIFNPPGHDTTGIKPAIVFFFGGGWRSGTPNQFVEHCKYLAERGMVAMVADYRVFSRHKTKADKCVADAKSAIRWMRQHAERLNIDPEKIVSAGGSAGGHLAASTASLPNHNDDSDEMTFSAVPNALALFNPVLVLDNIPGQKQFSEKLINNISDRLGASLRSMSPYHHVSTNMVPTIIFHGTADTTVEFETAELFTNKMREMGNRCELVAYEGEGHGFFNFGRKQNGPYIDTVNKLDQFLISIGYLDAVPDVRYE